MEGYDIEFYAKQDGTEPIKEFLNSLDCKMEAKVMQVIDLLAQYGPLVREPYSKMLEDGIFELRAKVGSDITRVLYFFVVGRKIILTNGFVKKSAKTPKAQMELAKKYRKDYRERMEAKR